MSPPKKRPAAVREPVQVYLATDDRALLDRVAKKTRLSRAEVLRRGVRRLAADVLHDEDPMVAFVREMSQADWPADTPTDMAENHDTYLAGSYAAETPAPAKKRQKRRKR
jgi:hypothetical protein